MRTSAKAARAAGSNPAVKSAAIETPVTEPMMMRTKLGGIVSAIAPEDASSDTISDRTHVGDLRSRDPGYQVHRRQQHDSETAAHMPDDARERVDQTLRDPRVFYEQAE